MSKSSRPQGLYPGRLLCPWDSPGKNPGVGCQCLLQGIFLTQGLNSHLSHLLPWQAGSSLVEAPSNQFSMCKQGPTAKERKLYSVSCGQPPWKGIRKTTQMYNCIIFLYSRNEHDIVNYSSITVKKKFFFFLTLHLNSSSSHFSIFQRSHPEGEKAGQSGMTLCDPIHCRLLCPWDSPDKSTGQGCHALLQGTVPTQGLNLGLLHWKTDSLLCEPLSPLAYNLPHQPACVCIHTRISLLPRLLLTAGGDFCRIIIHRIS